MKGKELIKVFISEQWKHFFYFMNILSNIEAELNFVPASVFN